MTPSARPANHFTTDGSPPSEKKRTEPSQKEK
jgi:hypothetical protein